ncbi:hypothetical protein [Gordonia sputi]|nr:hypothetical protein [Gordonia sputi]
MAFKLAIWLVPIVLILGIGWTLGGTTGVRDGRTGMYHSVVRCLPVTDQAALDACLNGGR